MEKERQVACPIEPCLFSLLFSIFFSHFSVSALAAAPQSWWSQIDKLFRSRPPRRATPITRAADADDVSVFETKTKTKKIVTIRPREFLPKQTLKIKTKQKKKNTVFPFIKKFLYFFLVECNGSPVDFSALFSLTSLMTKKKKTRLDNKYTARMVGFIQMTDTAERNLWEKKTKCNSLVI